MPDVPDVELVSATIVWPSSSAPSTIVRVSNAAFAVRWRPASLARASRGVVGGTSTPSKTAGLGFHADHGPGPRRYLARLATRPSWPTATTIRRRARRGTDRNSARVTRAPSAQSGRIAPSTSASGLVALALAQLELVGRLARASRGKTSPVERSVSL
jgi:hypothetical protein